MTRQLYALSLATPGDGVHDLSLHRTEREALDEVVNYLCQLDGGYDSRDIPADFEERVQWCIDVGNELDTVWHFQPVALPEADDGGLRHRRHEDGCFLFAACTALFVIIWFIVFVF